MGIVNYLCCDKCKKFVKLDKMFSHINSFKDINLKNSQIQDSKVTLMFLKKHEGKDHSLRLLNDSEDMEEIMFILFGEDKNPKNIRIPTNYKEEIKTE